MRKSTNPFARYTKEAIFTYLKKQTVLMVQQDIRWIQRFKHTHEPAWKVLKDYVESRIYRHLQLL